MTDISTKFNRRYEGIRWRLVFGRYDTVQQFAVDELQRMTQTHVPYVIEASPADVEIEGHEDHLLLCGTAEDNRWIRQLQEQGVLDIPSRPEGYAIACLDSPWSDGKRVIAVGGRDARGVLYGVEYFNTVKFGVDRVQDGPSTIRRLLDDMPDFRESDHPRIEDRGLWSWGYTIYDYRRYIDNMARLRMNMLTIWNDCPPINIADVIAYAHSRGVRVVMGFHWGWGMEGLDLADPSHVEYLKQHVLDTYENHYAGLDHDGIYFQTLTEHHDTAKGEVSTARIVCDMVNKVGAAMLERYPKLKIQFGLHATSILDHYTEFEDLDRRIAIVWEDAGVIPYTYEYGVARSVELDSIEATIEYSKKLAALRNKATFGLVPKGFSDLLWDTEFENHGPFILGERSRRFIRNRLGRRQAMWDMRCGFWMACYNEAIRFFREMLAVGSESITATALCEDGMFAEAIQPSIALFGHILWDPTMDARDLVRMAHSSYYAEVQ